MLWEHRVEASNLSRRVLGRFSKRNEYLNRNPTKISRSKQMKRSETMNG